MGRGASQVVLLSRSGLRTSWQRFRHNALVEAYGEAAVTISTLDVCNFSQACEVASASYPGGAVKGVWHCAMVLKDTLFENMTQDDWDVVNGSKVAGLVNLNRAVMQAGLSLDSFVAFSSVASLLGNIGQSNYAWANNACERLVEGLRRQGLPGTAIQWGAIDNVGFFVRNQAGVDKSNNTVGTINLALQNIDDSLSSLDSILACGATTVSSYQIEAEADLDDAPNTIDISVESVRGKVAQILGGSPADFDSHLPLGSYGLDSLSQMELMNWMNRYVSVKMTPSHISSKTAIHSLYSYLDEHRLVN